MFFHSLIIVWIIFSYVTLENQSSLHSNVAKSLDMDFDESKMRIKRDDTDPYEIGEYDPDYPDPTEPPPAKDPLAFCYMPNDPEGQAKQQHNIKTRYYYNNQAGQCARFYTNKCKSDNCFLKLSECTIACKKPIRKQKKMKQRTTKTQNRLKEVIAIGLDIFGQASSILGFGKKTSRNMNHKKLPKNLLPSQKGVIQEIEQNVEVMQNAAKNIIHLLKDFQQLPGLARGRNRKTQQN